MNRCLSCDTLWAIMPHDVIAPEAIVWTDAKRTTLAADILRALGPAVKLIGIGGPRGGDTSQLAQQNDLSPYDDLRKLLVDRPASFLLLATMAGIDAKMLQFALAQGTTILALEPTSAGFDQIIPAKAPQGDGKLLTLPAFTLSPAWIKAGDTQDILGQVRLVVFESLGPASQLSLHARLAEAWHVVTRFAGSPETIDCSIVGPLTEIPDDPRLAAGHLAAHARLPRSATAQVTISDQTKQHHRRLLVIGDQGRLLMTDLAYELHGPDGNLLEQVQLSIAPLPPAVASDDTFIQLAAAQWRRLIDHPDQTPLQVPSTQQQAANLGCQMACLLSARTGQPENPSKLAAMVKM